MRFANKEIVSYAKTIRKHPFRYFLFVILYIYICYSPTGRSVLGKTMPSVLSTARGGLGYRGVSRLF